MLIKLLDITSPQAIAYCALACFVLSFLLTVLCLQKLQPWLPTDGGRAFAVNGEKSKGKPRGAGIIFVLVHALLCFIFLPVDIEMCIYLMLIVAAMLSGYLDDASEKPWGELKKGLIDFLIAILAAVTYIRNNGSTLHFAIFDGSVELHPVLYGVLAVILIWAAINVVNCTDGVDGLCATLSVVSLLSFYLIFSELLTETLYSTTILAFLLCIMGYLWFNASPSKLLMGDAGSRAIGLLFAILALKCGYPLLFLPFCIVYIIDGGLGLVKVTLIRVLKVHIMKNTRTPLHDHARKNKGWSDTQTVFRFTILQAAVTIVTLYLVFL